MTAHETVTVAGESVMSRIEQEYNMSIGLGIDDDNGLIVLQVSCGGVKTAVMLGPQTWRTVAGSVLQLCDTLENAQ